MKSKFPELALYITSQREHGFFHIYARPVLVGTERSDSIRNVNDSTEVKGGWYLNDLRVYSQANEDRCDDLRLYGFEVHFDASRVTLHDAQRMAKTLKRLDTAMDRLSAKRGYARTYGEYVTRVAEALGAKQMVFTRRERGGWNYDDNDHWFTNLADGRARIEAMEAKWRETLQPATATA